MDAPPLGRKLGIHRLFSTRLARKIAYVDFHLLRNCWDRGFRGACVLRCSVFLPVRVGRGCNRTADEAARRVRWSVSPNISKCLPLRNELIRGEIVVEILLPVTLPAIAKTPPHAQGHHSKGRSHQDCDSFTDGLFVHLWKLPRPCL